MTDQDIIDVEGWLVDHWPPDFSDSDKVRISADYYMGGATLLLGMGRRHLAFMVIDAYWLLHQRRDIELFGPASVRVPVGWMPLPREGS